MRAVLASALRCARAEPVRERHRPEETLLYQLVEEHWPAFRARADEEGGLPGFVVRDFEEYLRCGRPEHGLCHLACASCGRSMVVAFSCKRRGFCPSCCGRRMADVAAHLVEEVLPEVPVRQWVCSLPWPSRTALAGGRELCADALGAFTSALERSLRRRAKRALGLASVAEALFGAITVVQRSDSALRVHPHFHTLALDGVYVRDARGVLAFHALGPPEPEDVHDVARWTHAGLVRALERRGRSVELPEEGTLASDEPLLASVLGASASDVQVLGAAPGQRTAKLVRALHAVPAPRALGAEVGGVDVHAERAIDGRDRAQIERLCRYLARPPLALERLERHDERRVRYSFKRAWKDGTHAVVLEPLDLLARLAALVPPPRFHTLRAPFLTPRFVRSIVTNMEARAAGYVLYGCGFDTRNRSETRLSVERIRVFVESMRDVAKRHAGWAAVAHSYPPLDGIDASDVGGVNGGVYLGEVYVGACIASHCLSSLADGMTESGYSPEDVSTLSEIEATEFGDSSLAAARKSFAAGRDYASALFRQLDLELDQPMNPGAWLIAAFPAQGALVTDAKGKRTFVNCDGGSPRRMTLPRGQHRLVAW